MSAQTRRALFTLLLTALCACLPCFANTLGTSYVIVYYSVIVVIPLSHYVCSGRPSNVMDHVLMATPAIVAMLFMTLAQFSRISARDETSTGQIVLFSILIPIAIYVTSHIFFHTTYYPPDGTRGDR